MTEPLTKISLADLAKYSHWSKRLTGEERFAVRPKNPESVTREFNDEKWGALLTKARANPSLGLLEIEDLDVQFKGQTPFLWKGEFYLTTEKEVRDRHLEVGIETLKPYAREATALVELGAGFGGKILNMGRMEEFHQLPLFAGEFTSNGQELIRLLSQRMKREIQVGYCDFGQLKTSGLDIPPGSIIFTFYAAHYVPQLSPEFPKFLAQFKPRIVVHFEPIYELHHSGSEHDRLCLRYWELNDYTRNLRTVLKEGEKEGQLKILREEKNVIGGNPFLPISIVEWKPV